MNPSRAQNARSDKKDDAEKPYDPNRLLDAMMEKLDAKNDAELCRALGVEPPLISKIRHRRLPVSASLLIRMHDVTDLSIRELRDLMADRRSVHRIGSKHFHFQKD